MKREIEIAELQLKETKQAVRLNDLKIKELRRHLPHNQLVPIKKAEPKQFESEEVSEPPYSQIGPRKTKAVEGVQVAPGKQG